MEFEGRKGVARLVDAWLRAELPPVVTALRAAWELPITKMPNVAQFVPHEPQALNKLPLVATVVSGNPTRRRLEVDDWDGASGATSWWADYGLDLYVWVKSAKWDDAIDMQDSLGAALTQLVLARPALDQPGDFRLMDETLVVQFSDVQPVKGDRFVAGTLCTMTCRVEESITPPLGVPVVSTRVVPSILPLATEDE